MAKEEKEKRHLRRSKKRKPMIARMLLRSKYILALGSTLATILIGLGHLRVLPLSIDIHSVTDGMMLVTLGVVILATLWKEFPRFQTDLTPNRPALGDIIALAIVVPATILGVIEIAGIGFPQEASGIVGMLHIILAIVMLFSVATED